MHTKNFQYKGPSFWQSMAVFTILAGVALAAENAPAPTNSPTPQNPFGPKPDSQATSPDSQSASGVMRPADTAPAPSSDSFILTLRAMLLRRFDKNSDGQLDASELAEARKILSDGQNTRLPTPAEVALAANGPLFGLRPVIMKRFDHRGDGQLDAAELAEINTLLFGPDATPHPVEDLAALQKDILRHFDKKGDGQLDATERAAAKAWLQQVLADLDKPAAEKSAEQIK